MSQEFERVFEEGGYGVYLVELKNHYHFELGPGLRSIVVNTNGPDARHQINDRTIAGTYRRANDLRGSHIALEIFRDFDVVIPRDSIKHAEKIRASIFG